MPFQNPIVGGQVLVRPGIQSPDYVPGVSGWRIDRDGSAEFNNIFLRGSAEFGTTGGQRVEITNTGVINIYNSANQLVVRINANGVLVQDPTTGAISYLNLTSGNTLLSLTPPSIAGHTLGAGLIEARSTTTDAWLDIVAPSIDGKPTATIDLFSTNVGLSAPSQINLSATNILANGPQFIGRGFVARAFDVADSAAVTAETVVLTATQYTYPAGRAFRASWGSLVTSSNASGTVGFRVRKTNAAGTLLGFGGGCPPAPVAGRTMNGGGECYFTVTGSSDVTAFICLTLQNFDGGVNTATHKVTGGLPRWFAIEDVTDKTGCDFGGVLA